jgi:CheY-like chemotaxis protein
MCPIFITAIDIQRIILNDLQTNDNCLPFHVLVVDDHDANIVVACAVLDMCGCTYKIALNGVAALEAIKQEDFDLILMDIQMPVMDGISATKCIREFENRSNRLPLPIIAVTAHPFTSDRQACLEAGMNDYILKPLDPDKFREILDRMAR